MKDDDDTLHLIFVMTKGNSGLARARWLNQLTEIRNLPEKVPA